jgi:hypothetical protein
MKCKGKFINILAVLVLGFIVFNLSLTGMQETLAPIEIFGISITNQTFEPIAHLFQILFILLIISPPLIVVMLFLILRELKGRNKMK